MNEVEVLRATLQKQANRIANLTLDIDLAHSQIEILTEKLNESEYDGRESGARENQ